MIHLLFGGDELSLQECVDSLKATVEPEELRDVNVSSLDAQSLSLEELKATCDTVPFLAERRLVVVRGLLSQFEARPGARGGSGASPVESRRLGAWEGLAEYLPQVPESTDLVLIDDRLSDRNSMLARIRPLAQVTTFPLPTGGALRQWIQARAEKHQVDIEPRAAATLAEAVGNNLRVLDLELQKLSLRCWGRTAAAQDVEELVAYAKEASIFVAVDAVIEGRPGVAIRLVHQLLDSGRPATYVLSMIARQVRLLLLAKDLKAQGVSAGQIGGRLSLSGYPLRKTLEQEGRLSHASLTKIHRKLLEVDVSIKTGELDDQLALDLLVAEVASPSTRR